MVLHALVDRVEVGNEQIVITGPIAELARLATLPAGLDPTLVPSFVREWRSLQDSNPCRRRERAEQLGAMCSRRLPFTATHRHVKSGHSADINPSPFAADMKKARQVIDLTG